MQNVKKISLMRLFFALMFFVVVSAGCGGGGGHYSGDFGNSGGSGQEVTPESVSPDVMPPEPEEPVLADQFGSVDSDEYGDPNEEDDPEKKNVQIIGNSMLRFLNKTTWKIESIDIQPASGGKSNLIVPGSLPSYMVNKIAFLISGDFLAWDAHMLKTTLRANDVTIQFRDNRSADLRGVELTAPIFRSAQIFMVSDRNFYTDKIKGEYSESFDWESIQVSETGGTQTGGSVAKSLVITNGFTASNGLNYTCTVYLTIDLLASIYYTDWTIKDVRLTQAVEGQQNQDPKNFTFDRDSFNHDTSRLTFEGNNNNDDKASLAWIDGKGRSHTHQGKPSDYLTVKFGDFASAKMLNARILKPFEYIWHFARTSDNSYHVFKGMSGDELVYISDYGPHGSVIINNYNVISDQEYWATLVLYPLSSDKPYIPIDNNDEEEEEE